MRLTIFNGSPRTGRNNTGIMSAAFAKGFAATRGNEYALYKLNSLSVPDAVKLFDKADCVLLAFPLYNSSMPSGVKEFVESLEPVLGQSVGKKVGFLVQFGSPEAWHARPLERYLENFTRLMGYEYLGTIIKGGCNSLVERPGSRKKKKILAGVREIGRVFGATGVLDKRLLDAYSKPERLPFLKKLLTWPFVTVSNRYYRGAQLHRNEGLKKSLGKK